MVGKNTPKPKVVNCQISVSSQDGGKEAGQLGNLATILVT